MKLTDVCEINPRSQTISDDMLVSFVAMPDVSEDGKINTSVVRPYGEVKKGYTVFQEGDILFAKITPCMENGKGARAFGLRNGIGVGSTEFHVLRPKSDFLDGMWLYYLTAWSAFRHKAEIHMTGSAGQKRVPKSFLESYQIDIPALDKQKDQVSQLNRIRRILEARQRQLHALDTLIKARFVEMFGDESQFVSAPLDNSVEEMFIGPFGSSLKNECFVPAEDGFCMVYEQKHAIRKTMDVDTRYVDEKKYHELQRFTVLGGDIIVSCRGTIGETFIVPDDAPIGIMHPSIMKIRLKSTTYNRVFFNHLLQTVLKRHEDEANGSGVKMAITATALGQESFIIPSMTLQNQFASFVYQVDKSKSVVQQALAKDQLLFDSLMQQYFG